MNRILVIDDDRELCTLIRRTVSQENIAADCCHSGRAGLEKLKENEYQLVILDVMMPGFDGFETLAQIRKESGVPVLMFTAKNDSSSKVRGLRNGADDYLTKPFVMEELLARIVSLIRRYTRFNPNGSDAKTLSYDGLMIDLDARSVTTENGTFELLPKEFDVLLHCAKNQGRILTKRQTKTGHPAKPFRMALGSLIIQKRKKLSDRGLVKEIGENPYLQYFIGCESFQKGCGPMSRKSTS